MIIIKGYWIINREKSNFIPDKKEFQTKEELENYREILKEKYNKNNPLEIFKKNHNKKIDFYYTEK